MNIKYLITSTVVAFFIICGLSIYSIAQAKGTCNPCDMKKEEGKTCDMKDMEVSTEPVFAVCVFSDGSLIDHKGADNMSDCLKTKRLVEKKWKNKAADVNTIKINGIEYQIDGEHLRFICDYVDAEVHYYEDGSWEIINIIGKHKKDG